MKKRTFSLYDSGHGLWILLLFFSFLSGQAQTCFNAWQIGSTGDDGANSVAFDRSGNVYITGPFSGTVDFDPGSGTDNHTSNGNWDVFLSKIGVNGNYCWTRTWGGTGNDRGCSVAIDKWGNVYVVGPFQGTVDFDPGTGIDNHTSNAGMMNNPFISKFDSNGNFRWARTWGGTTGGEAYSCTVDSLGSIYAAGDFSENTGVPVDFDPGTGVDDHYCNGFFDAWLVRYDSLGNYLWGRTWGGIDYDDGPSVAVDAGGVYDAGMFMSLNCDFDPGTGSDIHSSNGDIDAFVSKFDFNGNHLWTRTWGSVGPDDGGKVIADGSGHIYVAGYYADTVDFDPGPGTFPIIWAGGIADIYLSKLDTSGNFIWAKSMGGPGEDKSFAVALDKNGNLYTSGYFTGTADFYPGNQTFNLNSLGGYDIYISKSDTSGNFIWAKQMGGSGDDKALLSAVDDNGSLYTVGIFSGTADFDPDTGTYYFTSAGGTDMFISKIFDCPAGVENKVIPDGLTISPNPADDRVLLKIASSKLQDNSLVCIYTLQGQLLSENRMDLSREKELNIQNLPPGIYVLKVILEHSVRTGKIIKK